MLDSEATEKAEGVPKRRVLHGDCVQKMREMLENSIDAVVCDPPYLLGFMGSDFDKQNGCHTEPQKAQAWHEVWAREAIRVLKNGGHLLAFGGTRTYHRLVCALEDAGFEIVDCIQWIYGQGFNKVGKTGKKMYALYDQKQRAHGRIPLGGTETMRRHMHLAGSLKPAHEPIVLARKPLSASSVARQVLQNGCGALNVDASRVSIDGAIDPARKRYNQLGNGAVGSGGVYEGGYSGDYSGAENPHPDSPRHDARGRFPSNFLLSHVPGPDGCQRVGTKRVKGSRIEKPCESEGMKSGYSGKLGGPRPARGIGDPDGFEEVEEWECVEGCAVLELDRQSGTRKSGERKLVSHSTERGIYGQHKTSGLNHFEASEGGASRYFKTFEPDLSYCQEAPENDNSDVLSSQNDDSVVFEPDTDPGFIYQAKASRKERNAGLEDMPEKYAEVHQCGMKLERWPDGSLRERKSAKDKPRANSHPTVKPLALCDYLCGLICPPGGTILDPFMGSGSTGCSAMRKGFNFVGIEREAEYVAIARKRIEHWASQGQPEENRQERLPL